MPKINQYTDNSTIEDTDAMLTYDPSNGGSTKLTTFARIASWMSAKLAALGKKTAITSADQILMVNGSAAARIDYNVLAKAIIEQYAGSTVAGSAQSVKAALDALNSKDILGSSYSKTMIPANSDFNSYTTPGVYYVYSNSDGATMSNSPRKSSGKMIVMARHTDNYLAQFFLPSTGVFIRYVRTCTNGTWTAWTEKTVNYYSEASTQVNLGSISSASTKTFEELGLTKYTYGAYYVALRADTATDGTYVAIMRHNSAGYQISEIYKGTGNITPYITSDGVIKNNSATGIGTQGIVIPMMIWGDIIS